MLYLMKIVFHLIMILLTHLWSVSRFILLFKCSNMASTHIRSSSAIRKCDPNSTITSHLSKRERTKLKEDGTMDRQKARFVVLTSRSSRYQQTLNLVFWLILILLYHSTMWPHYLLILSQSKNYFYKPPRVF